MSVTSPLLRKIDAVTVPVPDLDAGLRFYRDSLGHELRWRNDRVGQAGLALANWPARPRAEGHPKSGLATAERWLSADSFDSHLGGDRTLILPGRTGPATREEAWQRSASESSHGGPACH